MCSKQVGLIQDYKHMHLPWEFYEYKKLIKVFTNFSGNLTQILIV